MDTDQTVIGAIAAANGHAEPLRIAFDDEPGRDLSPEQASAALKYLYQRHTSALADAILYANGFDKNANVKGRGERYKGRANG